MHGLPVLFRHSFQLITPVWQQALTAISRLSYPCRERVTKYNTQRNMLDNCSSARVELRNLAQPISSGSDKALSTHCV
jgi:hypothetical protein